MASTEADVAALLVGDWTGSAGSHRQLSTVKRLTSPLPSFLSPPTGGRRDTGYRLGPRAAMATASGQRRSNSGICLRLTDHIYRHILSRAASPPVCRADGQPRPAPTRSNRQAGRPVNTAAWRPAAPRAAADRRASHTPPPARGAGLARS